MMMMMMIDKQTHNNQEKRANLTTRQTHYPICMHIVFFIADDHSRLLEYEDKVQKLKAQVVILSNLHTRAGIWLHLSILFVTFAR